jgi:hypothetical protein
MRYEAADDVDPRTFVEVDAFDGGIRCEPSELVGCLHERERTAAYSSICVDNDAISKAKLLCTYARDITKLHVTGINFGTAREQVVTGRNSVTAVSDIVDLMVSFPTVIFTVPLIFCFAWFVLGLFVSGFDIGDGDFDLDFDGDGDIDGLEQLFSALHLGALGLPLALLMLSFGGWASSLMFSMAMDELGAATAITIAGGIILGFACGWLFVWKVGGTVGRALATVEAPQRSAALGCTCKVRTVEVSETFGDAEILNGPMRTSIVKVRAPKGQFRRGDVAPLVELDPERDAYWISEIDEEFQPHN